MTAFTNLMNERGVNWPDSGQEWMPTYFYATVLPNARAALMGVSAEDASLCPDDATLADMGQLAIWAEGVNGDVHLEIDQIWAAGC